jgi:hypothetical protein|tara:strand:- start:3949 stop:4056 length:108 start_codon:yes stop_codon:yes gene_type:complete
VTTQHHLVVVRQVNLRAGAEAAKRRFIDAQPGLFA